VVVERKETIRNLRARLDAADARLNRLMLTGPREIVPEKLKLCGRRHNCGGRGGGAGSGDP